MSAGAFATSTYQASYGAGNQIHPITVQPETLEAAIAGTANAAPLGAATSPLSAIVSSSRRGKGLHPRKVRAKILGAVPAGYADNSVITIPLLNVAIAALAIPGATLNYLGTTWTITGFSPELFR